MYEGAAAGAARRLHRRSIGLAAAAHFGGEHQVLLATVAFFPLLFLLALAMPERPDVPLTDGMAITLLGTLWIGLAIAHAIMLRDLPHGDGIVIDVLVGTFVGDTAAYLGGRAFGTRPLAPRVSPNKTVEGLAVRDRRRRARRLVRRALARTGWAAGTRSCSALVVGVVAPIGDLFESKIKRDAGTKDAGTLFGAARRRARPARRGIVHARRRVLPLAGAAVTTATRPGTSSRAPTTADGRSASATGR